MLPHYPEIIKDTSAAMAKLRADKAALLGYPSFAAYALEDQTAHDTAAVNKLLATPEVRDAILTQGAEPQSMSVANFDKMFQADFKQSKQVVESSGAKIE